MLAACKRMEQAALMDFLEQDVPFLLRRIPAEVLEKHYHGDEIHIKEVLQNARLQPEGGMELAAATVRGLFLTVSHRDPIGPAVSPGAGKSGLWRCRRLFPESI